MLGHLESSNTGLPPPAWLQTSSRALGGHQKARAMPDLPLTSLLLRWGTGGAHRSQICRIGRIQGSLLLRASRLGIPSPSLSNLLMHSSAYLVETGVAGAWSPSCIILLQSFRPLDRVTALLLCSPKFIMSVGSRDMHRHWMLSYAEPNKITSNLEKGLEPLARVAYTR